MTVRKKMAVTTIAASVAMTAFAGIPLSSKGLAEKLGAVEIASAAPAFPNATAITKARQLREALIATNGLQEVQALRTAINSLTAAQKQQIANPIVNKLMKGITDEDVKQTKAALLNNLFVDAIGMTYDSDLTALETLRAKYNDELSKYAAAAGAADLTIDDVVSYFLRIQEEAVKVLKAKSLTEWEALLTKPESYKTLLNDTLDAVPDDGGSIHQVIRYYGISKADVRHVFSALRAEVNDINKFKKAAIALYLAYLHMTKPEKPNDGDSSGIYIPPADQLPQEVKDIQKQLDELKDKLAGATPEEKQQWIAEAVKDAQAVVNKLTSLAHTVAVADGKASLKLDESKALSAIAGIAAAAASLQAATGAALPSLTATIDLGAAEQNDLTIGLPAAVMEAASKGKLEGIVLKSSGLTAQLPVGGVFAGAIDVTINKSDATEQLTGGLPTASRVYDFGLKINGVEATAFSKPVLISLPLVNTTGMDKELLTVAKVVDGKLEIHGGKIKGNTIVESSNTPGTYVVIENKVTFDDTKPVEAWAGRAIEVIAAKGAVIGKSERVFAPTDHVTRAEFAKMLIHALDLDRAAVKGSFDDVSDSDWFAPYIAAAAELKIINGRTADRFDPHARITRAEMAAMIARALKAATGAADVTDMDTALKGFSDAGQISASLKEGAAFAAAHGIVVGSNGKLNPNDNATRAQAAVMIYRAFNFEA